MLRVLTNITFVQQPRPAYLTRNKTLVYNFCHSYEAEDSWADLTNKAKIILPKNVYVKGANGKPVALGGTNVNIGGFDTQVPLFLKGDQVTIRAAYRYFDKQQNEVVAPQDSSGGMAIVFQGFISAVSSKKPIELECEDNMWKLKQINTPNKVFPASQYSLEQILQELLQGTGFTVNTLTNTSFGDFRTQNETVAEVLARLRKDYHFESYFRGNELRCGSIVYVEQDAIDDGKKAFKFEQDIISDRLEYKRKDDINLSAIAYSINKNELNVTTKDGQTKTRKERLEVLVTNRNGVYQTTVKTPGSKADFAPNTAGERRTLYFWNVTDTATLAQLAQNELQKYYYTGMRGSFETFGIPLVRQGDNVDVLSSVLPERNGRYKCKSVKYKGGVDGLRQEIELDYLVSALDVNGNTTSIPASI